MNRYVKIEGTDHKLEVVKIVPIQSEMVSIHFEELPNGKWRILYNKDFLPNFEQITAFVIKREGDKRFIDLKGLNIQFELSIVTAIRVRPNLIHFDKLLDGSFRLTYNSIMIPDFTKVVELTIINEEDVL